MTFEKVLNFKYLGADVNETANSHEEINCIIIAGNKCYFSLVPLFKSKLLSRRTKIKNQTLHSPGQAFSIVRLRGVGIN